MWRQRARAEETEYKACVILARHGFRSISAEGGLGWICEGGRCSQDKQLMAMAMAINSSSSPSITISSTYDSRLESIAGGIIHRLHRPRKKERSTHPASPFPLDRHQKSKGETRRHSRYGRPLHLQTDTRGPYRLVLFSCSTTSTTLSPVLDSLAPPEIV